MKDIKIIKRLYICIIIQNETINTTDMNTLSTRETTNTLKKYFRTKYGIDVKIKTEKYSGGSSINIDYVLGPDAKEIEKEVANASYGSFNSMEDIYEFDRKEFIVDGKSLEQFKYTFVNQKISDELWFQIAKKYTERVTYANLAPVVSIEQMNERFDELQNGVWTWKQLIKQLVKRRNFVTQDETKIEIVDVRFIDSIQGHEVIYNFEGKEYSTREYKKVETAKSAPEKKETPEQTTTAANGVDVVDYSERAIAVTGNTYEIKETLKQLGGKFNKFLKINGGNVAGWIFPKTKKSEVLNVLGI